MTLTVKLANKNENGGPRTFVPLIQSGIKTIKSGGPETDLERL
jgi:hypothetical protein